MLDVVEEVAEGRARVEWSKVFSSIGEGPGRVDLEVFVFRDAMKFDRVPALTWRMQPVPGSDAFRTDELFDGVRLPATALQLQHIADLTGCMLLTPKVIDLIWMQAGLAFSAVLNTELYPGAPASKRRIVATSNIHVVHRDIEDALARIGGDDGRSLIACVGKYWCLTQALTRHGLTYGDANACNYGWFTKGAPYRGVTGDTRLYQTEGFKHDHHHWDPSQVIRLMYRKAVLVRNEVRTVVDLHDIAASPDLAELLHHHPGTLDYVRQRGVPTPVDDVSIPQYAPNLDMLPTSTILTT